MPNSATEDTPKNRERTKSKSQKKKSKKDKKKNKDPQKNLEFPDESTPAAESGKDDHQSTRTHQEIDLTGYQGTTVPTEEDDISSTHSKNSASNFYPSPATIQSTSAQVLSALHLSPEVISDFISKTPDIVDKLMQYAKNNEKIEKDFRKKNKNLETSATGSFIEPSTSAELENSQYDSTMYTLQFSPETETPGLDDHTLSSKNPAPSVTIRNLRSTRDKTSLDDILTASQLQI